LLKTSTLTLTTAKNAEPSFIDTETSNDQPAFHIPEAKENPKHLQPAYVLGEQFISLESALVKVRETAQLNFGGSLHWKL